MGPPPLLCAAGGGTLPPDCGSILGTVRSPEEQEASILDTYCGSSGLTRTSEARGLCHQLYFIQETLNTQGAAVTWVTLTVGHSEGRTREQGPAATLRGWLYHTCIQAGYEEPAPPELESGTLLRLIRHGP